MLPVLDTPASADRLGRCVGNTSCAGENRRPQVRVSLRVLFALATLALVALAFAFYPSITRAESDFCPAGAGAGQCGDPQGLATDFETKDLFVAEQVNHRVSVFDGDGEFLYAIGWDVIPSGGTGDTGAGFEKCTTDSGCQTGISGSGPGQFSAPQWIAVDNDPASPNRHDFYVSDGNARVSHFKADGAFVGLIPSTGECQIEGSARPLSVAGPAGNVFVNATEGSEPNFTDKVMKFSPAGACLDVTILVEGNHRQVAMAVDSNEDAYVYDERGNGLRKYELSADETESCNLGVGLDGSLTQTVVMAVDENDHLYASQREQRASNFGRFEAVTQYDPSCDRVRRFGYNKIEELVLGIAPLHTTEGNLFLAEDQGPIHQILVGGPGPIAVEESMELLEVRNTSADIYAEVNPEGKSTDVRFDVVSDAEFEEDVEDGGDGFEGAGVTSRTEALEAPNGGFRVNGIEATLGCPVPTEEAIPAGECLVPSTDYHWRAVATNPDNEANPVGEAIAEGDEFRTLDSLEAEVYVTDVDTTTATLNASVNPQGISASGHFEYVDSRSFEDDLQEGGDGYAEAVRVPAQGELDFGQGSATVKRSRIVHPLRAGTVYRYRLVATNLLLEAPLEFAGALTTFPEPAKEAPCPQNEAFRIGLSEFLPDCRAYEMVSPLDKESGDIIAISKPPAVLNQSAPSGEKLTYGSYRAFGDAESAPFTSQYVTTRDAERGWIGHGISPPQGHLIKNGVELESEFRAFSADLCQGWIVPLAGPPLDPGAQAGHRNLYRSQLCGDGGYALYSPGSPERLTGLFKLEPQGFSADGEIAAFMANDSLSGSGAPPQSPKCGEIPADPAACTRLLYVTDEDGVAKFACVLPGGTPTSGPCTAGSWFAFGGLFGPARASNVAGALSDDGGLVYWTDGLGTGEIYVRENPLGVGPECTGEGAPCTHLVTGDGNSYFAAAAEDGSLAYYTSGSLSGGLARLYAYAFGSKESTEVAGSVFGVLGASGDGSRIYFASGEVLDPEANEYGDSAQLNKPNLYLREAGEGVTFIGTLAGNDVDPFAQLFEQSSATSLYPPGRNSRVTPSGSHAAFMSEAPLTAYDTRDASTGVRLNEVYLYDAAAKRLICPSCNPSGARPEGSNTGDTSNPFWVAARIKGHQNSLYAGANLSPSGDRLFFESLDPLAARDNNGRFDVYQWERAGVGRCTEATPSFVPAATGCVDLISSGQDKRDAAFVDAGADGEDVFFTTLSSLVPEDYGLVDIYDARVGGGFPAPPQEPAQCEGEACQGTYSPPPPPSPASVHFRGPGNLADARTRPRRCPKGKVKRRGKCVKKRGRKAPRGKVARARPGGSR